MEEEKKAKPLWAKIISLITLTVVFGGLIVVVGGYAHYRYTLSKPTIEAGVERTVVVPQGTPWSGVVRILSNNKVVVVPLYFDIWSRQRGLPAVAKAGTYVFKGPLSFDDLAKMLTSGGNVSEMSITIPEGFSIFKIGDLFEEKGLIPKKQFLEAATSGELMKSLGVEGESMEGFLFPDTYRFKQGASGEEIARKMHARWKEKWDGLIAKHPKSLEMLKTDYKLEVHEIVTLASIVERETGIGSERDLISRVFLNRFNKKMRMQTDPTCVYGATTYLLKPSPKTCKDPLNRYSTYVIDGLPPGPIANPGAAALEAVLKPSEKKEAQSYLYFVATRDGKGGHAFSKNLKDHNKAVQKLKSKIRSDKKKSN